MGRLNSDVWMVESVSPWVAKIENNDFLTYCPLYTAFLSLIVFYLGNMYHKLHNFQSNEEKFYKKDNIWKTTVFPSFKI